MSDKKEKKLLALKWEQKTGLTRKLPTRMVKMVAAVCSECVQNGPGWYVGCPHDPYHSMQAVEDPQARFSRQDDGTYIEDTSKTQVIKAYRKIPNVRQVALSVRVDSGLSVESALAKGWKMPEDVFPVDENFDGYAPMCEFNNCYAPNPQIKTKHEMLGDSEWKHMIPNARYFGHYCTENHARLARLKDSEFPRYVAEATKESAKSARAQLQAVVL